MNPELTKLIAEQKKDMTSRHVSRPAREVTYNPEVLENMGLTYDEYHGWVKDDV